MKLEFELEVPDGAVDKCAEAELILWARSRPRSSSPKAHKAHIPPASVVALSEFCRRLLETAFWETTPCPGSPASGLFRLAPLCCRAPSMIAGRVSVARRDAGEY